MSKIKSKISFKDNRGIIKDLITKCKISSITFISHKKNKIRGNHYHKKTTQWNYVLNGKLKFFSQIKNVKKTYFLNKGEISVTKPNEKHAIKAEKNSEYLVFTEGPRSGRNYELDTFRLNKKLI
jgi:quercetin dioxygenase-like cupin family protein